jgi:hypothetical protein
MVVKQREGRCRVSVTARFGYRHHRRRRHVIYQVAQTCRHRLQDVDVGIHSDYQDYSWSCHIVHPDSGEHLWLLQGQHVSPVV